MSDLLANLGSVLLTGVAAVLIFSLVVFIHELGHFMAAKFSGVNVQEFAIGMGPTLFRFQKKETTYAIRLFPIGGFVSMESEDVEGEAPEEASPPMQPSRPFEKAPIGNRILIIAAGAVMNFVLGFVVLVIVVSMDSAIASRTVAQFNEGASTSATGLQLGDTIVAVNGRRCFIANDILYEFARTQEATADITVRRDGKTVNLQGVKFNTTTAEDGTQNLVLDFKVHAREKTVVGVLKEAGNWTISYARLIVRSVLDLVTGHAKLNELSGPVGVVSAIGKVSSLGLSPTLLFLALITINLGVFNILPLPALDGGKLALLFVEAIRRKPLNRKIEIAVNTAGFFLLIGLMLFATYNDIARLF